jgi:enoyl-CoA hydratase/carnithine racemase
MLCDLAVASENATFAVPEALIGAIPPIAATIGAYLIGKHNISMMMLTGEPITAYDAERIGLINKVVPSQELKVVAEQLAKSTMRAAPSSIKAIKKLMYQRFNHEELMQAVEELIKTIRSEDGREGHKAFVEKRQPKWTKT